MNNYKNKENHNDKAAYTNTDYILKSIVQSLDNIEESEVSCIINTQEGIFEYYARVNALYSKINYYIGEEYLLSEKKVNVKMQLLTIRSRLYNQNFHNDMKKFNEKQNNSGAKLVIEYKLIIDMITHIYRHLTYELSRLGIFFIINKENTLPGVVR